MPPPLVDAPTSSIFASRICSSCNKPLVIESVAPGSVNAEAKSGIGSNAQATSGVASGFLQELELAAHYVSKTKKQ